jgi:hypothetical protein
MSLIDEMRKQAATGQAAARKATAAAGIDPTRRPGESLSAWLARVGGENRAAVERGKKEARLQEIEKFNEGQLARYDEESGKFFDQMREGFRMRSQALGSAQATGAMSQLQQASARAGLSFSGVGQAAQTQLQGQLGAAQVEAQASYDQRLAELRGSQRHEILSGQMDFFESILALETKYDLDKEYLRFQADLADQYSSGWNDFFNVIGQGVGLFSSGYLTTLGTKMAGGNV